MLLDYKTQQAQDRVLNTSIHWNVKAFSEGDLVYLLAPHASSFQMGTTHFHQDYLSPLIIDTVLYSTHYELDNVGNRVFIDTFHINRLKQAFLPIPSATLITQRLFNNAIYINECTDNTSNKTKYL